MIVSTLPLIPRRTNSRSLSAATTLYCSSKIYLSASFKGELPSEPLLVSCVCKVSRHTHLLQHFLKAVLNHVLKLLDVYVGQSKHRVDALAAFICQYPMTV